MSGPETSLVCQSAYEGDLGKLKDCFQTLGMEALLEPGFISLEGKSYGLWETPGANTVQLMSCEEPGEGAAHKADDVHKADALQFAAFANQVAVIEYLLQECGMSPDQPGALGMDSRHLVSCHRLDAEGEPIEFAEADVEKARDLLQDEAPLDEGELTKTVSRRQLP